jgi:hypothetical protein
MMTALFVRSASPTHPRSRLTAHLDGHIIHVVEQLSMTPCLGENA